MHDDTSNFVMIKYILHLAFVFWRQTVVHLTGIHELQLYYLGLIVQLNKNQTCMISVKLKRLHVNPGTEILMCSVSNISQSIFNSLWVLNSSNIRTMFRGLITPGPDACHKNVPILYPLTLTESPRNHGPTRNVLIKHEWCAC